eukprot:764041-Hanusia_phi.AAC.1
MRRIPIVALFVQVFNMRDLSSKAKHLGFRLTIKNQKDDNLSISMDEVIDFSQNVVACEKRFGFDTFMTLDLLKDAHAGYVYNRKILVQGTFRCVNVNSNTSDVHKLIVYVILESDLKSHMGGGLFDLARVSKRSVSASSQLLDLVEELSKEHTWIKKEQPVYLYNARNQDGSPKCARIAPDDFHHAFDRLEHVGNGLQLMFVKYDRMTFDNTKSMLFVKVYDDTIESFKYAGCYTVQEDMRMGDLYTSIEEGVRFSRGSEVFGWHERADGCLRPLIDSKTVRLSGLRDGCTICLRALTGEPTQLSLLVQRLDGSAKSEEELHICSPLFLSLQPSASVEELLSLLRLSLPAGSEKRLLLCDHDVAINCPAAPLLWDDCCTLTRERISDGIQQLLARQHLGREKFGLSLRTPYIVYVDVLDIHEMVDTTILWYGRTTTRELTFTFTLSANTCLDDIMRKLRQMAPVRGTGDLRLLSICDHRVVHFFQDPHELIAYKPTCMTLRAEEVPDDDYCIESPTRYVEFVRIRKTGIQGSPDLFGDPFLLSVGTSESVASLRKRVSSKLDLKPSQVSLYVVLLGTTLVLLSDRAALFSQHDLDYGDCVAIETNLEPPVAEDHALLEEASESILKAAKTSNLGYLMQYPDDSPPSVDASPSRSESKPEDLDIQVVKRSLENHMKQFSNTLPQETSQNESISEQIQQLEEQLGVLQSEASDHILRLESEERIEELLAVNASMELHQLRVSSALDPSASVTCTWQLTAENDQHRLQARQDVKCKSVPSVAT